MEHWKPVAIAAVPPLAFVAWNVVATPEHAVMVYVGALAAFASLASLVAMSRRKQ